MFTFDQVKELIDLVAERRLGELEIERSGYRLRIAGAAPMPPVAVSGPWSAAVAAAAPGASAPALAAGGGSPSELLAREPDSPDGEAAPHLLTSPIVGTFYASPSPDAEPYVRPGERIEKGQVVCIVEAMKLMNEIESDVDGIVREVLPENAQPVEFGTPLLAVEVD